MNHPRLHVLAVATASLLGCAGAVAQAVNGPLVRGAPDNADRMDQVTPYEMLHQQLAPGHIARYRITYFNSNTATANRSATVISVTNQGTATCATSVDWKIGFGGVTCTTVLSLGPGQTGEHCTRGLPSPVTVCNATCSPALTAAEGSAILGAENTTACSALAISARTYHTTGANDDAVAATTDAKVVRINVSNAGD